MSQPRQPPATRLIARNLPAPQRLDRFLRTQFPDAGRRSIQSLIAGGRIGVNGRQVRLSSWLVRNGDSVELQTVPRAKPRPFAAFDDGWIIAEAGELVALNKPAGLLSEPTRYSGAVSLLALAEARFGPVTLFHRLDRDTSGVIVLTRSAAANRYLDRAFQRRAVEKEYVAVVGAPNRLDAAGVIDLPIGHDPARRDQMMVVERGGKPATTRYQVVAASNDTQWLHLRPQTGRTHQLRVHLAHMDAPIVGDRLYGRAGQGAARLMLHAWRITLPAEDAFPARAFAAPLPADLTTPPAGWPAGLGAESDGS